MQLFTHFIELFTTSAPWLLVGLLIAGIMQWLVPLEFLKKQLGENNLLSVVKAAIIGAPLPLCSCGVIPAAIGLRRSGASKSATISFLVATPETGVDSISVSYALLGPFIAVIRPVFAVLSAVYAGIIVKLVEYWGESQIHHGNAESLLGGEVDAHNSNDKTCCAKQITPEPLPLEKALPVEKAKPCCQAEKKQLVKASLKERLIGILSFASGKLLQDLTLWLLIGLFAAAAIKTWLPQEFLTQWGDGFLAMLVMALIGIPMYICATASTPMAAGFLAVGVSPGAILVFMLAGPATNLSTMGMIRQEMGKSVLFAYLFSILSASIGLGYLTNFLVEHFHFQVYSIAVAGHETHSSLFHQVAAVVLLLLMARNWVKQAWPRLKRQAAI